MADWSPSTYLKFEDERTRAARNPLAQVPGGPWRRIVDVGRGPGNSTDLLAERYADAEILGLDNSPAMLEAAPAESEVRNGRRQPLNARLGRRPDIRQRHLPIDSGPQATSGEGTGGRGAQPPALGSGLP